MSGRIDAKSKLLVSDQTVEDYLKVTIFFEFQITH